MTPRFRLSPSTTSQALPANGIQALDMGCIGPAVLDDRPSTWWQGLGAGPHFSPVRI
jgi:hypothetical protein